MAIILGVDPGVTGALAWVEEDKILGVTDHSAWANAHGPARELHLILKCFWKPVLVVIEDQHARPGQAVSSTSNLMKFYGILLGCTAYYGTPVHIVDPAVWKANMRLDQDKTKSLVLARELWPQSLDMFKRQKDHGRAEAALLAEYGKRFLPLPAVTVKRRVL